MRPLDTECLKWSKHPETWSWLYKALRDTALEGFFRLPLNNWFSLSSDHSSLLLVPQMPQNPPGWRVFQPQNCTLCHFPAYSHFSTGASLFLPWQIGWVLQTGQPRENSFILCTRIASSVFPRKGPDNKYFQPCGPYAFCHISSALWS